MGVIQLGKGAALHRQFSEDKINIAGGKPFFFLQEAGGLGD